MAYSDPYLQFSADNTAKTFAFNSSEAQKNRDWQAQMSNTAHAREVADLKKAGLNPVLSANANGATTPTGSAGSGTADSSGINALANVTSALIAKEGAVEVANINAGNTVWGTFNKFRNELGLSDKDIKKFASGLDLNKEGKLSYNRKNVNALLDAYQWKTISKRYKKDPTIYAKQYKMAESQFAQKYRDSWFNKSSAKSNKEYEKTMKAGKQFDKRYGYGTAGYLNHGYSDFMNDMKAFDNVTGNYSHIANYMFDKHSSRKKKKK